MCNPYTTNDTDEISLECSVRGPPLPDDISLTIKWVRNLFSKEGLENLDALAKMNPDLVEIMTQSVLTQTPPDVVNDVRSVLTLHDVIPNDVAGNYYCVVEVTVPNPDTNGVTMITSQASAITTIRSEAEYGQTEACRGGIHRKPGDLACVRFNVEIPEALRSNDPPLPPDAMTSTTAPKPTTDMSTSSSTTPPSTSSNPSTPTVTLGSGEGRRGDTMLEVSAPSPIPLDPEFDGTVLSTTMIIILASVGSGLCIVIHVLLALVSCLWVKSRRKRRVKGS